MRRSIRSKRLAAVAKTLNLAYQPKVKRAELPSEKLPFDPGNMRIRLRHFFIISEAPLPFMVYDYTYVKRQGSRRETVALFDLRQVGLPGFRLSEITWRERINRAMGIKVTLLAEREDFSSKYCLNGRRAEEIVALFEAELLDYLSNSKGWSISVWQGKVSICKGSGYLSRHHCKDFIAGAQEIAGMLARNQR